MDVPILTQNALYLPGVSGNWASTPDSAGNSVGGDLDLRIQVALTDWSPAANPMTLASKFDLSSQKSWLWAVGQDGSIVFYKSTTGSDEPAASLADPGYAPGSTHWLRVTSVASSGLTRFYTSPDGNTWTQTGSDTTLTAGAFYDSSAPVVLGASNTGGTPFWHLDGNLFYFEQRSGINGSVVQSFDATSVVRIGTRNPSSVTAGGPWTISGSNWDWMQA